MSEQRWLTREIGIVLHGMLIEEHGGAAGVRDEHVLEAALARPRHKRHYQDEDLPALAAAYAFALSSSHPFVDGNKRVALAALDVFLRLNGWGLDATEVSAASTMLELAAGHLGEEVLTAWVEEHAKRL